MGISPIERNGGMRMIAVLKLINQVTLAAAHPLQPLPTFMASTGGDRGVFYILGPDTPRYIIGPQYTTIFFVS